MRSRNYTAVQFDKSLGKHSELERYISKTNGEIKKRKKKKKERRASSADGAGEDKWKSPENHAGAPVTRRTGMRLYFDSSHVHSYNA